MTHSQTPPPVIPYVDTTHQMHFHSALLDSHSADACWLSPMGQVRCRNKHEELFDRIWKPLFSTDCELQHAVAGPGQLIAAWLKNTNVEAVFCSYLVERLFTPMDNDQTAVLR